MDPYSTDSPHNRDQVYKDFVDSHYAQYLRLRFGIAGCDNVDESEIAYDRKFLVDWQDDCDVLFDLSMAINRNLTYMLLPCEDPDDMRQYPGVNFPFLLPF